MDNIFRKMTESVARCAAGRECGVIPPILDLVPLPIFCKDRNGRYIGCNSHFETYLGLSRSEIIGRTVYEVAPPELAAIYGAKDAEMFAGQVRQEYETEVADSDGNRHNVIFMKQVVTDDDGSVAGIFGVVVDITEEKRAQQELAVYRQHLEKLVETRTAELRETNRILYQEIVERKKMEEDLHRNEFRYRTIFHSAAVGLWEEDFSLLKEAVDGLKRKGVTDFRAYLVQHPEFVAEATQMIRVVNVNDMSVRMYGAATREDLLGRVDQLFLPESVEAFCGVIVAIAEGKNYYEAESVNRTLDGRTINILINVNIPTDNDTFSNLLVSILDITDRKRLEAELVKAQKLESVGVLAGGIAHDFNNMLTTILGNISLAARFAKEDEGILPLLRESEKAALRAKDLTKQLLTFSKGGSPVKRTISIAGVLQDAASFALHGSAVQATFSIPEALPPVHVDEGQLSQVVNNIVLNAVQAMPAGGTVHVSCRAVSLPPSSRRATPAGQYLRITVSDTGHGISEGNLPKIFDPYFTTKDGGSGLGLATAYAIVRNHGGHITVRSKVGRGTSFHIYLPVSNQAVAEQPQPKIEITEGHGRILVMDDDRKVRDIALRILRSSGFDADGARNGEEALSFYSSARQSERPYDAVILDLTVAGGMGGQETMRKLLEIDPRTRGIVSSGYCNDAILSDYEKHGFRGILCKPYQIDELCNAVNKIIASGD